LVGKLSKPQKDVLYRFIGRKYEEQGKKWLRKRRFKIVWGSRKPHNDPYDVEAIKDGMKWIIEIKGGVEPSVNVANLERMYEQRDANMLGLLFVRKREPFYLFELPKIRVAGQKDSIRKGKKMESIAGRKSWKLRKRSSNP
jgi:hypothetical protein